jgi:hypothetical protein
MLHHQHEQFFNAGETLWLTTSLTKEAVDVLMAIDSLSEGLKEIEARFLDDASERRTKLKAKLEAIKSVKLFEE